MKVARTELVDLCKKVFEGMKFPLGDYEDCAQVIAWLEFHGLPILAQIQQRSPEWVLPQSQAATILFENETMAVIDAQQNGGLVYGSLAVDLAYLKARQHGLGWVHLERAAFRQLIIPSLVRCATRGMNGLVFWQNAELEHVVTIEAEQKHPTYLSYPLLSTSPNPNTLSICCTTNFNLLPTPRPSTQASRHLAPDDFVRNYRERNDKGIEVADEVWAKLVVLSKKVLVEATEESRLRGAGEQAA